MQGRFRQLLLIGAAASLLYAGPVTACFCIGDSMPSVPPMPSMPCCPDEGPHGPDEHDAGSFVPADLVGHDACTLGPSDLLQSRAPDFPPAAAIAAAPLPELRWPERSAVSIPARFEPYRLPPIYLTTRRLRH